MVSMTTDERMPQHCRTFEFSSQRRVAVQRRTSAAIIPTMSRRGKFITFEGLDGTGKSTQMRKLAETLRAAGHKVIETREPGGTATGEKIRRVLLDSKTEGLSPMAEMALMFASRAQHIAEVIQPALDRGQIVLCDRFTDSTEAYQGSGRKLGSKAVLELHRILCGDLQPDLTDSARFRSGEECGPGTESEPDCRRAHAQKLRQTRR